MLMLSQLENLNNKEESAEDLNQLDWESLQLQNS